MTLFHVNMIQSHLRDPESGKTLAEKLNAAAHTTPGNRLDPSGSRRRPWGWGLWGAVVLATLAGCSPPKAEGPNPMTMALNVTVDNPQSATVTNWDEYPGHLEAVESVELRPQVAGYIESIHFKDGAEVKAGDLLFVIDPRPFQAEFDHAQALRHQAETRLELAQSDLKRAEGLRAAKAISEEEYDTRRNAVVDLESGIAAAKAAEATARINLDYTQIKAPITGKIGRRLVTPGNYVQLQGSGGATVLATIVTQQPIYCYFDAQEQVMLEYNRQAAGRGAIPCELALANEEGFPHHGTVDFVDNQVDPRTGTIRMRAVFENADRVLVPGLFANVRIPAGPPVAALLIADVAIQSNQGHKFVYVAGQGTNQSVVAEPRPVKVGRAHGDMRAVLEGLTPADRVVIDGLMMLRPGAKLQTRTAAEAAAAAAKMAAGAPGKP